MNRFVVTLVIAASIAGASCAGLKRPVVQNTAPPPGSRMWVEPTDFATRDLYNGPWGAELAPDLWDTFTLVETKHSGVNIGMTVKDGNGREWSVKQAYPGGLDPEGPVEVALSRILSGVGYPQPPVYDLPAFRLKDDWGTHIEAGGRFRLKEPTLTDTGFWKWEENPFVGSKPYQGLIVMLTMFNSTDLKNSNNTLYEHRTGDLVERWYVVRDIGAALGDTNALAPRKGNAHAFERYPFITGVNDGKVRFADNGWYKNLVRDRITPEDVAWASNLLGQLTPQQWEDAFRAGGYAPEVANRFIAKLREKIEQGRSVGARADNDQSKQ